jgi:hypothetical protein
MLGTDYIHTWGRGRVNTFEYSRRASEMDATQYCQMLRSSATGYFNKSVQLQDKKRPKRAKDNAVAATDADIETGKMPAI